MKKIKLMLLVALIAFACNISKVDDTVSVKFSGDKFGIESGQLKSFDINKWQHYHYPHLITVTLTNTQNNTVFITTANNGKTFFETGTDVIQVPVGSYRCVVNGGGYPENDNTHSESFYFWNIKDTIVNIIPSSNVIKFSLNKTAALVIKDSDADIKLIAYRDASLYFTGKGEYDFAYVTPGTYAGEYTDSSGYKVTTEWFNIKRDNYYYFITPSTVKSGIVIPEFIKNEINF